jgi:hypothetical protein
MCFSFRNIVIRVLAVAALLISLGVTVHAQSQSSGAVNGAVADAQNKAIAGANVEVRNVATNVTPPAVKTDSNGRYLISNLQPGMYDIEISASGLATYKQASVVVEVGRATTVDAQLGVAGKTESVSVTAEAPVVNTEDNGFSTNINSDSIENLPLNTRRWSSFALSMPGAIPDGTFGDISFRGITGLLNNNTIDGGDNNEYFFAEEKGRTRLLYSASLNAIQEFQVNTSNYSAEYGRSAGGVVNAVTKSGSNTFHGDVEGFDRDARVGGAYAPFAVGSVQTSPGVFTTQPLKPTDRRIQSSADIGGWLIKNKLFWYFNVDGGYRDFPMVSIPTGTATFLAPITVAAPSGGCTASASFSGTAVQTGLTTGQTLYCRAIANNTVNPPTIAALQTDVNAAQGFLISDTGTVPRTGEQTIFFPKIDYHPTSNNTITASYNRLRWDSPYGIQTALTVARGLDSIGNDYVKDDTGLLKWTFEHGGRFINEARYEYSRDFEFELTTPAIPNEPVSTKFGVSPQIDIGGTPGFTFGAADFLQRAAYPNESRHQFADTVSWTFGKHTIKFGADINRVNDTISNLFQQFGEYSYVNITDFYTDYLGTVNHLGNGMLCATTNPASVPCYSEYQQGFGPLGFSFNTWDTGLFVQDDWHMTRKLTVDLGLRWENESLPGPQIPNTLAPLTGSFPSAHKNFGPRLGFALDVFGDGKTVVRGGAGIYYGRIINETIFGAIADTGNSNAQLAATVFPTTGTSNSLGTLTPGAPLYAQVQSSFVPASGAPNIVFFAKDARPPAVGQFDFIVEHEIAPNTVISLSYIGSVGRFLPIGLDSNLPAPSTLTYTISGIPPVIPGIRGPGLPGNGFTFTVPFFKGARPNTAFQQMIQISTAVKSDYNAAVLQFNRRMTHGLQIQASYTFAHAIDDGQASSAIISTTATVLDPANLGLERANSNYDQRQHFVGSLVWTDPYFGKGSNMVAHAVLSGWTVSPIGTMSSGLPFTPAVKGNAVSGTGATVSGGGYIGDNGNFRVAFLPRNGFYLPPIANLDMRIARSFSITERLHLQLSVDAYNIFNKINYTATSSSLTQLYSTGGTSAAPTLSYLPTFGQLLADNPGADNTVFMSQRLFQFGARFSF